MNMEIKEDELTQYIVDNFKENALLEISYNRVFVPGILLNINNEDSLILTLQLQGQLLHQTVDVDIEEILSELVEIKYTHGEEEIILTII